jgi:8-oxo-dGTP pyrophosphatase MutT (NUDIX family)
MTMTTTNRNRQGAGKSGPKRSGRTLRLQEAVSAGGVVYRRTDNGLEIALCGRTASRLWALPKGTPQPGETIEQTARREVREETGLDTAIERGLGSIEYWFARAEHGLRFHKTVHHFLMAPIGGDLSQHDDEYDVVRWFAAADAEHALTYANEAEMVRRAMRLLAADGGAHEQRRNG